MRCMGMEVFIHDAQKYACRSRKAGRFVQGNDGVLAETTGATDGGTRVFF